MTETITIQLYILYWGVMWKRSRMARAREGAEEASLAVWPGPGRMVRRILPVFADQDVCGVEEGQRAV